MCNNYLDKLELQLKEAYARVCYTYTAHHKEADQLLVKDKHLRFAQIVFTSISTAGFLGAIIKDYSALCWIAGGTSAVSLAMNLYSKDFRLQIDARIHKEAADELWDIREDYVSILTDIEELSATEIREKRNELMKRTSKVNKKYPGTTNRAYKAAQKALKIEEEQTFSDEEIERLLPNALKNN